MARNRLELSARLLERGALRHTPAGLAALEFKLGHESEQDEAGAKRKVQGFLSAKSKRSKKLMLHVTEIEFVEGA